MTYLTGYAESKILSTNGRKIPTKHETLPVFFIKIFPDIFLKHT